MKLTLQQGEAALRAIGRAYPPNADQEGLERLRLHVERQVRKLIVTGKSIESDLGMAVFNIAIAQRQGTLVSTAIDKLLAKVWKAARR